MTLTTDRSQGDHTIEGSETAITFKLLGMLATFSHFIDQAISLIVVSSGSMY